MRHFARFAFLLLAISSALSSAAPSAEPERPKWPEWDEDRLDDLLAHATGFLGDLADEWARVRNVRRAHRQGFVESENTGQCTGSLPFRGSKYLGGLSAITQLKHTWLKTPAATYGMPYTLDHHYWGGDAVIMRPDPFLRKVHGTRCYPLMRPKTMDASQFDQAVYCIAEKASVTADHPGAAPVFTIDYHAFRNNCASAVRFLAECAGGRAPYAPNFTVGDEVHWDHPAKLLSANGAVKVLTIREACAEFRQECGL